MDVAAIGAFPCLSATRVTLALAADECACGKSMMIGEGKASNEPRMTSMIHKRASSGRACMGCVAIPMCVFAESPT